MKRVLEPEILMDEAEQAAAYAASDFTVPHNRFVSKFGEYFPEFTSGSVADLCCGPADPTIRFAIKYPATKIWGYDGASAMLQLGRKAVQEKGLESRVTLVEAMLPLDNHCRDTAFDAIVCNGSLHHFEFSRTMWQTVINIGKPGCLVYIVDLTRPATEVDVQAHVQAARILNAPEKMVEDYRNSLRAAFRPEEIRHDLDINGLQHFRVEVTTPTHMTIWGTLR